MLVANSRLLVVNGLDVYALVCIFCFFAHPGRNCQDCIGKPGRCLNTIRSSLAQGSITMPKPSHSRSSSNEPALGKELFLQVWPILSRWIVQNDLGAVPASLALWWEMAVGRHHGQAVGRHGQAHSSLEPIDRTATDFMPPLVMEAWQCVHHWMSEVIEARKVVAADRFFKRQLVAAERFFKRHQDAKIAADRFFKE